MTARPGTSPGRSRTHARAIERRSAWAFVTPALFLLMLFLGVPALLALGLSFTNARLISPNAPEFTGLENYVRAFTSDPVFLRSLLNTFYFAAVVVPVQAGLGLALALLVNQRIRGVNIFRTVFFLPVVTSMVVVSILWTFMYQEDGLINSMLSRMTGGLVEGTAWLQQPSTAMPAIIILSVWQGVGFHMVIWLAGLQTIPAELYEAATVDGAGAWQRFRNVTWPGLRPTLVFVLVTITIAAFGLFVQIDVMTRGGPLDSTTTIIFHAVRKGFREQEVGYGAALSLIFFVLVLIVSLIQRRLTRENT
ncbi:carbohydrate ABC transporter permease [Planobispora siamensis]|uniref:Sugar ABC transporter permease n=1 Tax=Planobispora siamensis TaxID=936338 RepID=A0A8J3SG38_9ACTN|nr:sugar ABC transporter permease [Planobispora siamensis]GIH91840.1 sugar ABC transporter permease [Planobispora siamensis]